MRYLFVICFIIIALIQTSNGQSLKVVFGDLTLFRGGDATIIKSGDDCEYFQGYDLIDNNHVFIAYQPLGTDEATTILCVVEIGIGKEIPLTDTLRIRGFCTFQYNSQNDLILFDWFDGAYVLKVHDSYGNVEPYKKGRKPRKILSIDPDKEPFSCFWIDAKRYGVKMTTDKNYSIHELE